MHSTTQFAMTGLSKCVCVAAPLKTNSLPRSQRPQSFAVVLRFAFLVPLLLCHGRRAYRRVASFLCYYFYKNVALAFGDFIWAHQNSFSGEVAYPEWLSTSFNAVFTWWPVIIVLAFDQDIPDSISNAQPRIYTEGIKREWFNIRLFALWMTSAAFQGSLAWILPNFLFGSFDYEAVDFWRASATSFTMVIVIVALKLALHDFKRCSLSCLLPIIGSIASYIIVLFLLGYVPLGQRMQPNLAGDPPVPGWIFSNATPILVIALASPLALLPDAMALLWVRKLHPSPLFQIRSKNLWLSRARLEAAKARPSILWYCMIYQICRLTIQKPALSFFLSVSTSLSICTAQETMHKAQPTYRYSMCIYLFMCTCLHMWVYMCKHKDIHRYVCIWVHIYTYVHVYI